MNERIRIGEKFPPINEEVTLFVDGHRGTSFSNSFQVIGYYNGNEYITSPICKYDGHQSVLNNYGRVVAFKPLSSPPTFEE